ncbi:MAG: T9SS type A sorting domain-containing protein, partial [Sphingobacteriales bacterium]
CSVNNDGGIDLTVSGGNGPFSFAWAGPSGFSAITEDLSGLSGGTYTVTVTGGGCSASHTATVTQPAPLTVTATANGNTTFCPGDSVVLAAATPDTNVFYEWQLNGNTVGQDSLLTATQAGDYTVIVSNASGCPDTAAAITITLLAAPVINLMPGSATGICQGDTLYFQAFDDPAYTYTWYLDSMQLPGADSSFLATATPGVYHVSVAEAGGCTTWSDTVLLTVNPIPVAIIDAILVGGNPAVTVTTPFASYEWFRNGLQISGFNGQYITNAAPGTYYVVVTDINGCTDTSNLIVVLGIDGMQGADSAPSWYPNPAREQIRIVSGGRVFVTIVDMKGAIVVPATTDETIDIRHLSGGVYTIILEDSRTGNSRKEKLVKLD